MNIYVAGLFEDRERLKVYASALEELGHNIVGTWLWTKHDDNAKTAWQTYAVRDTLEVTRADAIILDTLNITPRGGREVEWGGFVFKVVPFGFIVGPARNVFHELATKRFNNWGECVEYFSTLVF